MLILIVSYRPIHIKPPLSPTLRDGRDWHNTTYLFEMLYNIANCSILSRNDGWCTVMLISNYFINIVKPINCAGITSLNVVRRWITSYFLFENIGKFYQHYNSHAVSIKYIRTNTFIIKENRNNIMLLYKKSNLLKSHIKKWH